MYTRNGEGLAKKTIVNYLLGTRKKRHTVVVVELSLCFSSRPLALLKTIFRAESLFLELIINCPLFLYISPFSIVLEGQMCHDCEKTHGELINE